MKRRDLIAGTIATLPAFHVMKEVDWVDRDDMIKLNDNFEQVRVFTGLKMEMINLGEQPGDGQGDYMRVAAQKINRNFATIQNWLELIS
jgi:hypothetical protein